MKCKVNVDTGELRRLMDGALPEEFRKAAEKNTVRSSWQEVPDELQEETEKELAGRDRTFVDMEKDTPLTAWARGIKQGRNNPCACGSGKKYKKCCLKRGEQSGKEED